MLFVCKFCLGIILVDVLAKVDTYVTWKSIGNNFVMKSVCIITWLWSAELPKVIKTQRGKEGQTSHRRAPVDIYLF